MSRRTTNRRGIKKRGLIPSFGDIVLPIVGIAAVGLLFLAGKQFFASGMKSSPSITSTRAYTDSPAVMAEREESLPEAAKTPEPSSTVAKETPKPSETVTAQDKAARDNTILAVAENSEAPRIADVKPAVSRPAKSSETVRASDPVKPSKPAKVNMTNLPPEKQWRVQVGAYPSKAQAERVAKKIKLAGYKARTYQNPESKHVKVWVEAGENSYQAGLMIEAMKKLGFKSSFSFPPMKQ
ncbi:MAG: SPOR domain-containing protein [Synergistaceae bacterium]|nr:SPOR domain-containing protein [Synergistaceae bacterium]